MFADGSQIINDICATIGMCCGFMQCNLSDNLGMRCIAAKFISITLSSDHKVCHVTVHDELKIGPRDNYSFIFNIVTGNETWVYNYEPETKQQSTQWKSPTSLQIKKYIFTVIFIN